MTTHCEPYCDLLVDYTDGDLSEQEMLRVREHVDSCSACRVQLARLQHSLEHAQSIWRESTLPRIESAGNSPGLECGRTTRRLTERPAFRAALTASAIVLGILVAIIGPRLLWQARPTAEPDRVADREPQRSAEPSEVAEIKSLIARETRFARLATSADYLADDPSLALYRQNADDYLAAAYVDSQAGQQVRKRRESSSD